MPSPPPGFWTTALPLRGRWALYFLRGVVLMLVLILAPLWSDLREHLPSLADALPGSLRAGTSPGVSYYCGMAGGSGFFTRMELSAGHIQIYWATLAGPGSWKQSLLGILMDTSACAAALILLFWALTPLLRWVDNPPSGPRSR